MVSAKPLIWNGNPAPKKKCMMDESLPVVTQVVTHDLQDQCEKPHRFNAPNTISSISWSNRCRNMKNKAAGWLAAVELSSTLKKLFNAFTLDFIKRMFFGSTFSGQVLRSFWSLGVFGYFWKIHMFKIIIWGIDHVLKDLHVETGKKHEFSAIEFSASIFVPLSVVAKHFRQVLSCPRSLAKLVQSNSIATNMRANPNSSSVASNMCENPKNMSSSGPSTMCANPKNISSSLASNMCASPKKISKKNIQHV